jgi:hypothetical protein
MGTIGRLIVWAWRRFADYNTLLALLDVFDAKTGAFALLAWVMAVFYTSTNTSWSPQAVVVAAFVIAACVAIIVTALRFRADKLARRPAAAFEIVFDPHNEQFVKREENKTLYRIGLHILSQLTVDFPNILIIDSPFTERLFGALYGAAGQPIGAVRIYQGGALDSDVLELIYLFELPNERRFITLKGKDDPLGGIQTFTVQARGRHCRPVDALFEYNPDRTPMIRMLT